MFKIRRNSDGLFSTGGMDPRFTKEGKVWNKRNHVSAHLNQIKSRSTYADCAIVEYELIEIGNVNAAEWMSEVHQRKSEREAERLQRAQDYQRDERRKMYNQLKREFG